MRFEIWKLGVEINVGVSANYGFHWAEFQESRSHTMVFFENSLTELYFNRNKNIENKGKIILPVN